MSSTSAPAKASAAKRVAKKTDTPAAPVAAAAAPAVVVAAPAKATKAKKEAVAAPAVAAAAAPVASEVTAPVTEAAPQRSISEEITDFVSELTKIRDGAAKMISSLKKLDKRVARDI